MPNEGVSQKKRRRRQQAESERANQIISRNLCDILANNSRFIFNRRGAHYDRRIHARNAFAPLSCPHHGSLRLSGVFLEMCRIIIKTFEKEIYFFFLLLLTHTKEREKKIFGLVFNLRFLF